MHKQFPPQYGDAAYHWKRCAKWSTRALRFSALEKAMGFERYQPGSSTGHAWMCANKHETLALDATPLVTH